MVDATENNKFLLNKKELQRLFQHEALRKTLFLVLANKQDKQDAVSVEDVIKGLELDTVTQNTWSVFGVSALSGKGIEQAFDWLVGKISLKS